MNVKNDKNVNKKPKKYKSMSINRKILESLKRTMEENEIVYRNESDAVHKAIDKYILDLKLKN